MDSKNLIVIGLLAMVVILVVAFLFMNGTINLSSSKLKNAEQVSSATIGIGNGVEKVGSTLEDIDKTLG